MAALFFASSVSRSLFTVAAVVLIVAWVVSGEWRLKWYLLQKQQAGLLFTGFLVWIFASGLWSEGSYASILDAVKVQWKLLLIPIILTVISKTWAKRCWMAFASGSVVLLLHVYLLPWIVLPWVSSTSQDAVFFNPIPQSVSLAIFSGWCLFHLIEKNTRPLHQLAFCVMLAAATYVVVKISQQRIGYLAWIISCASVIANSLASRKRLYALALLLTFFITAVAINPAMQARIFLALQEIQAYEYQSNYTNIGARLHMWYTGIKEIREQPLAGHGLGSYREVMSAAFNDEAMCAIGCSHPHSQYIFYTLEFGLIGLGLFIAALYRAWRALLPMRGSVALPITVLLVFVICSFADTLLWYRGFLYLFVPLLGLCLSNPPQEQATEKSKNSI